MIQNYVLKILSNDYKGLSFFLIKTVIWHVNCLNHLQINNTNQFSAISTKDTKGGGIEPRRSELEKFYT